MHSNLPPSCTQVSCKLGGTELCRLARRGYGAPTALAAVTARPIVKVKVQRNAE